MANLKRNMITLVKDVKEGELITETYWTPMFIPFGIVYEAMDLLDELEVSDTSEREQMDKLMTFIADKVYGKQFKKKELFEGLHGPDAVATIMEQLLFVAQGVQTDETKKFLDQGKKV